MTTTDWANADAFLAACPHSFNALQHLVMAMANVAKHQGKKSLFGRDKGLAAYKDFELKTKDMVYAMVLDGVIERNSEAEFIREKLVDAISLFEGAFPNWQDAYSFAAGYFIVSSVAAEERIRAIIA